MRRLKRFFARREAGDEVVVYLFGSVARGDDRPGSDVDVGVLYRRDPPATFEGLPLRLEGEIERRLGRATQVVTLNTAPAVAHCVRHYHLGLRPKPPAAASGDPRPLRPAPRPPWRTVCGITTWGCAPNPRRPLAGTPSPRAASAVAHCVRHYHLGLRLKPPAAASGDPFAPRRVRRGALCAALPLGAAPQTPGGR